MGFQKNFQMKFNMASPWLFDTQSLSWILHQKVLNRLLIPYLQLMTLTKVTALLAEEVNLLLSSLILPASLSFFLSCTFFHMSHLLPQAFSVLLLEVPFSLLQQGPSPHVTLSQLEEFPFFEFCNAWLLLLQGHLPNSTLSCQIRKMLYLPTRW